MCFLIFCHKCDWLRYIGIAIEFNINHLFNHQIVIPFFCNFPQLLALVCGWKLCWKKYMSPTKIFCCRILKQFVNQITLLWDGKCHCNAAKTVLRQLIVAYLLKVVFYGRLKNKRNCQGKCYFVREMSGNFEWTQNGNPAPSSNWGVISILMQDHFKVEDKFGIISTL